MQTVKLLRNSLLGGLILLLLGHLRPGSCFLLLDFFFYFLRFVLLLLRFQLRDRLQVVRFHLANFGIREVLAIDTEGAPGGRLLLLRQLDVDEVDEKVH